MGSTYVLLLFMWIFFLPIFLVGFFFSIPFFVVSLPISLMIGAGIYLSFGQIKSRPCVTSLPLALLRNGLVLSIYRSYREDISSAVTRMASYAPWHLWAFISTQIEDFDSCCTHSIRRACHRLGGQTSRSYTCYIQRYTYWIKNDIGHTATGWRTGNCGNGEGGTVLETMGIFTVCKRSKSGHFVCNW